MLSFNFNLPLYHILKGIIMPHTLKKNKHTNNQEQNLQQSLQCMDQNVKASS